METVRQQKEEDRVRWVRLCRTAPVKAIQVCQQFDISGSRNPFRFVHSLITSGGNNQSHAAVNNNELFNEVVFDLLHKTEMNTSPRFDRWQKRYLTREWSNIIISQKVNALKMHLLELNQFRYLWIRVSVPLTFSLHSTDRCFGTFSNFQTFLCKGKLDVVPHWKNLISTTDFGHCEQKRVRVVFFPPVDVPLIQSLPCSQGSVPRRVRWKASASYSKVKNGKLVTRDKLDTKWMKINHAWCYFDGQQWAGFSFREIRKKPRSYIIGEISVTVLLHETKRFDSLLKYYAVLDMPIPLWHLICEYDL